MTIDVPKFMNSLVADLQSDAWDSDVRLVLDASTPMDGSFDSPKLHRNLSRLLACLIQASQRDGTISVVTSFEPAPGAEDDSHGFLHLTITASLARTAVLGLLDGLVGDLRTQTRDEGGAVHAGSDAQQPERWSLTLTLPATRRPAQATRGVAVVVDDDVDMQDFLTAVLESRGFKVIAVNDGFDALIVIDRYQPDVVLTDLFMPNMDGFDLVGRIKQVRGDLPIIVFTGYYDSLASKPDAFGVTRPDFVLPKPMTQAQVITALDKVLPVKP